MATLDTATVYPGACLLEGLLVSEGRGTVHPFEWAGAPWIDEERLEKSLNDLALPGTIFRAIRFIPGDGPFAKQRCAGVQVHVTDRLKFRPVKAGICFVAAIVAQSRGRSIWTKRNNRYWIDHLWGSSDLRQQISSSDNPLRLATKISTDPGSSLIAQWKQFLHPEY